MRDFRRLTIPERCHPLVRELWKGMNYNRITIRDVAERAGVAEKTVKSWRTQRSPNLTNLDACLNVLGLKLIVKERADP